MNAPPYDPDHVPVTGTVPEAVTELDAAALAGLAQLDPTGVNRLVVRVLGTYLTSLARQRLQMEQALAVGDLDALKLAVHTLKSASASVGALALSALCAAAENAVREDHRAAVPDLMDALLAETLRVDAAVRRLLTD